MKTQETTRAIARWLMAAAASVGFLAIANPAEAGLRACSSENERLWVEPVYETLSRVVTVAAVYEKQPRRIWHEPVYEVRIIRVELPARVVKRRIPRYSTIGRVISYKIVEEVVEPPRTVRRKRSVLVHQGYYETIYERVLIRRASTRVVNERVLVRDGYWAPRRVVRAHTARRPRILHAYSRPHLTRGGLMRVARRGR